MAELQKFEEASMGQIQSYVDLDATIKKLTETQKSVKEKLLDQMEQYGVKSIDNDLMKITKVNPSESTSVDLKAFEKQEPIDYAQLLEDYPKVTKRKASIRITVKKVKA